MRAVEVTLPGTAPARTAPDGLSFQHRYAERVPDPWWLPYAVPSSALVWAGLGKMATRPAGPDPLMPASLRGGLVERVHPYGETVLGVATLMSPAPSSRVVSAAGAALVTCYAGVTIRGYRRGLRHCACFGTLGSGRLTPLTLGRTATLAALATLAAGHAARGGSAPSAAGHPGWGPAALSATVVAALALAARRGRSWRRASEEFVLPDRTVRIELRLSAQCGPCAYLRRILADHPGVQLVDAPAGSPTPTGLLHSQDGQVLAHLDDPALIAEAARQLRDRMRDRGVEDV